ncbi:hypothetical protein JW711_03390 [Candidatus Woesearchaeota archaeon]|nr:hypothetical protein [Candidatus Woesearchaeota archaeon]
MNARTTLEHLLTPIRISPHGSAYLVSSALFTADAALRHNLADLSWGVLGFLAGVGFYQDGLRAYLRTRVSIKKHNRLDERVLRKQMGEYCIRQGARTAAANAGQLDIFDKVYEECRKKNLTDYNFMPHF